MVKVIVYYTTILAEYAGKRKEVIEVKQATKLGDLIKLLVERYPRLHELYEEIGIIAVLNGSTIKLSAELKDGDEVVLIPPSAGG
jgi:MoaD family protein